MEIGEYVVGKLGRGRLVAITEQWAIYKQRSGNEKVEPIALVDPIRCGACRKHKALDDRPWYYTNGKPAKSKLCRSCGRIRFEEKGVGWKVWHLEKCPKCGKNPRNWDTQFQSTRGGFVRMSGAKCPTCRHFRRHRRG